MTKRITLLHDAIRGTRAGFVSAIIFSFFINVLAFVGPLYMLQIYDRVITSRNVTTLIVLTIIAAFLLISYALLEKVRSAVLVRLGLLFAARARRPLFNAVLRGTLLQPAGGHSQALRDLDTLREFLTGTGLISFCDAPWVPIFVVGCFILHPWYGFVATGGAVLIFALAIANELMTRSQLKDGFTERRGGCVLRVRHFSERRSPLRDGHAQPAARPLAAAAGSGIEAASRCQRSGGIPRRRRASSFALSCRSLFLVSGPICRSSRNRRPAR